LCERVRRQERLGKIQIKDSKLYTKNREAILERHLAYRKVNAETMLLTYAKRRARDFNLSCTITTADISIPTYCPIFGFPLVRHLGRKGDGGRWQFDSPTVDRIVPALGYVPGNIQVISHKANSIKSNHSIEDLRIFAEWILR